MITLKLASILEERKISHREFSRLTGIRHPTISAMCNNTVKHIPLDNLNTICNFLECNITDILDYKKDNPDC
jgi:putative transcriptional regulator